MTESRPISQPWTLELVQRAEPVQLSHAEPDSLVGALERLTSHFSDRAYRIPSVREALGVPSIHRCVTLISSTTGMLSMRGYRDGELMAQTPQLAARPDPYHTPGEFYSGTAANIAKHGEFVWWIATRDGDNRPSALVVVPLRELKVEENKNDRLRPKYTWGSITGTRYSPANPTGVFVHVKYPLSEPYALRGRGPLQLCGAATSVTVEAQTWAANFYAEGGNPNVNLHDPGDLTDDEASAMREQWVSTPANTPQVTSGALELRPIPGNEHGAQMLEARQHNNGDAARMFGIPGSLLEYQMPGSNLTYQNLEGEFTKLVRTCLQPLYLEPIEQAMSDLLSRSTVARFNVDGFLRADTHTRYKVHKLAIDAGIYDQAYAQRSEGIVAGDIEFQPVPASPPTAIPTSVPRVASIATGREVRCPKGHLLAELASPPYRFTCFRCKSSVAA